MRKLTPPLFVWFCLLALLVFSSSHAEEDELLEPQKAFALTLQALDSNRIEARWQVADGYYLYRDKIGFESKTPGVSLGEPRLPDGKIKQDEFFGQVETYRGEVRVAIPVQGQATVIEVMVTHQGCADIGVCYPPQRETHLVSLPASGPVAGGEKKSPLATLREFGRSLTGGSDNELLEADKAFRPSAIAEDGNTLLVRWDIAPGYYLYKDKFSFGLSEADGISLGQVRLPEGKVKEDETFGRVEVFYDQVETRIPLLRDQLQASRIMLDLGYQGCADIGVCYPPQRTSLPIDLPAGSAGSSVASAVTTPPATPLTQPPVSEQDRLASALAGGNTAWTILLFFVAGLLLAFTPCVFPMIPILSSIIVGQGEGITTRRAFVLSLTYVLAMAATYTVAGVIAGLFGANLQATFQNPWILGSFAAVFVALSFAMFGFYELQLPSALQSRISQMSNSQKSGTLTGVAIMGLLSALIVGPCVGPPLMGALIYIGQTGDPWLGGTALFALSMGMGAPLIAIGTAGGKFLPRAGGWMDSVKAVFGVLMLAVAIWMLERILPASLIMAMWAMLLIVSAVYMGGLDAIRDGASGWQKLWKGLGLVLLIYGAMLLFGAAAGNTDPLQPVRGIGAGSGGAVASQQQLDFKYIGSVSELEKELAQASANGQPAMLNYTADWCVTCKELERYTYSDPQVIAALSNTVLLKVDVTANNKDDQELLRRYRLIGPPALIFYNAQGEEQAPYRLVGFISAGDFIQHIRGAFGG